MTVGELVNRLLRMPRHARVAIEATAYADCTVADPVGDVKVMTGVLDNDRYGWGRIALGDGDPGSIPYVVIIATPPRE